MRINYPAILVCALLYWLLGGLWYGLLFHQQYVSLEHLTAEQSRSVNAPIPYITTFLLNLLLAFVLAHICMWRNANTAGRGAAVGVLLWIGIVAPITYTTHLYELRPKELFAINEFYPLLGMCLMGAILGAWKKKAA